MRPENTKPLFIFVFIFYLTIAQNVHGSTGADADDSGKNSASTADLSIKEIIERDKNEIAVTNEAPKNDKQGLIDKHSRHMHKAKRLSNGDIARYKRSMLSEEGFESSLEDETNSFDQDSDLLRAKRIISDYGYGTRLQAGENLANSHEHEGLFGVAGPGKRSLEITDFDILTGDAEKDKRLNTDYGYGSRLQAGENVAMDWDRHGLFGIIGPGKRNIGYTRNLGVSKRTADFGYGSRFQAAKNAAMSSNSELFGAQGPGKRNGLRAVIGYIPEYKLGKRLTPDYGYGSRLQAAENIAQSSPRRGLFGLYGPGKRSIREAQHPADKSVQEDLDKRIESDFGYGSREQAAENLANFLGKTKVFGIYGPGKRSQNDFERNSRGSETLEADGGYGSRIQAGSQIAKDVVAINDIFGSFGPGRRKRAIEFPNVDLLGEKSLRNTLSKRLAMDAGYGSRDIIFGQSTE